LFINTEMWQMVNSLSGVRVALAGLLLFAVGAFFFIGRLPVDVAEIGHFDSWHECNAAARLVQPSLSAYAVNLDQPLEVELSRRQWLNVGLVLLFSQAVVVTIVGLVTFAFFVVFGAIAIDDSVIESWTGSAPYWIGPEALGISGQLLKVAGFIGAFSALYFTVYLVTDETYRREFRSGIVSEVRAALAVCALYRRSGQRHTPHA
jgi:hypothetical protein